MATKPRATTTERKPSAKKKTTSVKKSTKSYGPHASEKVGEVMDEMKAGTLRSGGSGAKVTDRKQAIAIALSEARRDGAKVPSNPKKPAKKT